MAWALQGAKDLQARTVFWVTSGNPQQQKVIVPWCNIYVVSITMPSNYKIIIIKE